MTPPAPANPSSPSLPFETATIAVVQAVRDAFVRIIEYRCPGSKVVTSLCEAFGIHRKLAWQVSKVAYSDDPFVAAMHVPSGKSLAVWLDAARDVGVPRALIEAAQTAADRFDELASSHAANRAELEMLFESSIGSGSAASSGLDEEAHAKWREQSFRGNSFVWGAHCRVLLGLLVLQPSDDVPGFFHCAQIRGLMGYRQTRSGVKWVVNQSVVADEQRTETGIRRVPLVPDAAQAHGGVPVLPQFCSSPMPRFTRRVLPSGIVLDEFVSAGIGQTGERTLVTGEVARNIGSASATPRDKFAYFGTGVRIPAELLHFDLFVHHSLCGGGAAPRPLRAFSDLASPAAFDDADALPVPERIAPLGRGVSLAQTPDIPAYTDLAAGVFAALSQSPGDYDLFRVRMPFPPMPVSVMMRHTLPPPPSPAP